ncbi:MAG: 4-hydroxy-3-methylbut-2-enyl diphosphate reductase [Candidatus Omnitrophica bacterium]|nr:4-hydroxy-3-methylbut-2-enyl diphosphate reductase [Candidatus Omnitrophota bacterium]
MGKIKIIISRHSGFCFGVRRSLNIAGEALKKKKTIYSLGPIIHNPQVVREFSRKGLKVIKDIKGLAVKSGKSKTKEFLIPSHGISPGALKNRALKFIDTTCPLVGRVHKIVADLKKKGYFTIIAGDRKHPEVRGLRGIAGKNSRVLKSGKEARRFGARPEKVALISQTTATLSNFREILSELEKKNLKELKSFNTVCKNTIDRQREAKEIAKKVDAMIIIGGKNSANTTRLAKICKMANKNTYHIESRKDLDKRCYEGKKKIGIATGASTPPYAIEEIIKRIRSDY